MLAAEVSLLDAAVLSETDARIAVLVLPQHLRCVLRQADALHTMALLEVLLRPLRLQTVSLPASLDLRTVSPLQSLRSVMNPAGVGESMPRRYRRRDQVAGIKASASALSRSRGADFGFRSAMYSLDLRSHCLAAVPSPSRELVIANSSQS